MGEEGSEGKGGLRMLPFRNVIVDYFGCARTLSLQLDEHEHEQIAEGREGYFHTQFESTTTAYLTDHGLESTNTRADAQDPGPRTCISADTPQHSDLRYGGTSTNSVPTRPLEGSSRVFRRYVPTNWPGTVLETIL